MFVLAKYCAPRRRRFNKSELRDTINGQLKVEKIAVRMRSLVNIELSIHLD